MESSSSRDKSSGKLNNSSFQRSNSPSARFCSSTISSSSSGFAPSMSGFKTRPEYTRSSSPTRVSILGSPIPSSSSIRFSYDRPMSPGRSMTVSQQSRCQSSSEKQPWSGQKKTCMCSPTTHPGSFRCSYHRNAKNDSSNSSTVSYQSHRLHARRSAMTNSLVRIGTVEGDLMKRALAALIRPSSHQQRRRSDFQPRPSRFSVMSKASD